MFGLFSEPFKIRQLSWMLTVSNMVHTLQIGLKLKPSKRNQLKH